MSFRVFVPVGLLCMACGGSGTANMDRAFRWTDTPAFGYQANVYDIAPPLYEIVEQFGANRFDVTLSK